MLYPLVVPVGYTHLPDGSIAVAPVIKRRIKLVVVK